MYAYVLARGNHVPALRAEFVPSVRRDRGGRGAGHMGAERARRARGSVRSRARGVVVHGARRVREPWYKQIKKITNVSNQTRRPRAIRVRIAPTAWRAAAYRRGRRHGRKRRIGFGRAGLCSFLARKRRFWREAVCRLNPNFFNLSAMSRQGISSDIGRYAVRYPRPRNIISRQISTDSCVFARRLPEAASEAARVRASESWKTT